MLLIVFAVVFLVILFLIKNTSIFKKIGGLVENGQEQENGLTYSTATIEDLVNKDTDQDGVLDWEEGLWGTDPAKKETTPGTPDSAAVRKMKAEQNNSVIIINENNEEPENLTETDKFSRELFSTVAATTQSGALDQATVDQISGSLADHIQNSPQRKIYVLSDLKVIKDNNVQATKKYNDALNEVYVKYPIQGNVLDIFKKFIIDQNNIDSSALSDLDPIIKQTRVRMDAMLKVEVPEYLSNMYLNVLNGGERLVENLEDIKLYDTDSVVALSGISKYQQNITALGEAIMELTNAINQRLRN